LHFLGSVAKSSLCYNSSVGTLFLVATPIGNLEDITQRALHTLRAVELIAAEDTRHTRKLLEHYKIDTPLISYHEHNKLVRVERLLETLDRGEVALVSDAGTPGLSDPGYLLVQAALAAGHRVSPIPGPSAPIAALVASGLPTDAFIFLGYLPRKTAERRRLLKNLAGEGRTMLAFEAPHRLLSTLQDLETIFGPERSIAVCRELTKVYEEIMRCSVSEAREHFFDIKPRGEFTLVIAGAPEKTRWGEADVRQTLKKRLAEGLSPSEAARVVAAEAGWSKREVYRLSMEAK
jgi:16S rRNA (cytidine1402-2'-O)-methyltransferase